MKKSWFALNNSYFFPLSLIKAEEPSMRDAYHRAEERYGSDSKEARAIVNKMEYKDLVGTFGAQSKEARHFHLRRDPRANYNTNYSSTHNGSGSHLWGDGVPSTEDQKFHQDPKNETSKTQMEKPDPKLHAAISRYGHELQKFLQDGYKDLSYTGNQGKDGKRAEGNKARTPDQIMSPVYTQEDNGKGAVVAKEGRLLQALRAAKDAAKEAGLDLHKDKLLTHPAYFHEIFSSGSQHGDGHKGGKPASQWGSESDDPDSDSFVKDFVAHLSSYTDGDMIHGKTSEKAGENVPDAKTVNNIKTVTGKPARNLGGEREVGPDGKPLPQEVGATREYGGVQGHRVSEQKTMIPVRSPLGGPNGPLRDAASVRIGAETPMERGIIGVQQGVLPVREKPAGPPGSYRAPGAVPGQHRASDKRAAPDGGDGVARPSEFDPRLSERVAEGGKMVRRVEVLEPKDYGSRRRGSFEHSRSRDPELPYPTRETPATRQPDVDEVD